MMIKFIKTVILSYQLGKEEKKKQKEKELQDKFWQSQVSFEE